jgi:hypothetical protein
LGARQSGVCKNYNPAVVRPWGLRKIRGEMMTDPDRAKAKRASDAMTRMVKIDIAVVQAAFAGTTGARHVRRCRKFAGKRHSRASAHVMATQLCRGLTCWVIS